MAMKIGKNVVISMKASIYNPDNIEIGDNVRIDDFCILSGGSGLIIGNNVHIACYSALFAGAGIIMEDFSGLSARVTLYSESDDYSGETLTNPTIPMKYKKINRGQIILRKHCIIGVNSTVLPGVIIGEGTSVGAYSLVKSNCEPWSIYAGIPAKRIKGRKKNMLELEKRFFENTCRY